MEETKKLHFWQEMVLQIFIIVVMWSVPILISYGFDEPNDTTIQTTITQQSATSMLPRQQRLHYFITNLSSRIPKGWFFAYYLLLSVPLYLGYFLIKEVCGESSMQTGKAREFLKSALSPIRGTYQYAAALLIILPIIQKIECGGWSQFLFYAYLIFYIPFITKLSKMIETLTIE